MLMSETYTHVHGVGTCVSTDVTSRGTGASMCEIQCIMGNGHVRIPLGHTDYPLTDRYV